MKRLPPKASASPVTAAPAPVLPAQPPAAETIVAAPPAIPPAKSPVAPTGSIDVLGLNDKILDALQAAGIETIDQLLDVEDLTTIAGIGRVTAERIVASLRKWADGSSTQGDG